MLLYVYRFSKVDYYSPLLSDTANVVIYHILAYPALLSCVHLLALQVRI